MSYCEAKTYHMSQGWEHEFCDERASQAVIMDTSIIYDAPRGTKRQVRYVCNRHAEVYRNRGWDMV